MSISSKSAPIKSKSMKNFLFVFVIVFVVVYVIRHSNLKFDGHVFCTNENHNACHRPFFNYESGYFTAKKYNLNVCASPKGMSTIISAVMCYLAETDAFIADNRTIFGENAHTRYCMGRNEFLAMSDFDNHVLSDPALPVPQNWTHILVVRDPLERLISGFLDKCVVNKVWETESSGYCFECKTDLNCFLRNMNEAMKIPFRYGANLDTHHFFPQSWRCDVGAHYYDRYKLLRIFKNGTKKFWDQFFQVLKESGVEGDKADFIAAQVKKETSHATSFLKADKQRIEDAILTDHDNYKLFVQMLYYDYVLFGFKLPEGRFQHS